MLKNIVLVFTLLGMGFISMGGVAQTTVKVNKKNPPPFLVVTEKLPHLTKGVMKLWDNPQFGLTETQKPELLALRKETIKAVNTLSSKIAPLERQVTQGIFSGKTPEMLQETVDSIARLKKEATMVHLVCIFKTKQVLTKAQFEFLLKNL